MNRNEKIREKLSTMETDQKLRYLTYLINSSAN